MDTISHDLLSGLRLDPIMGAKYKALARAIRQAIAEGRLSPGDKLPPVREAAWTLGITPGTVARAYTLLTVEAVLNAAVGRGTFVADRPADSPAQDSPAQDGPAQGRMRNIDWQRRSPPENTDQVSLFSTRLPDMGQVAMIHAGFAALAQRPMADLLNYPSRTAFEPARRAVLRWLEGTDLGPIDEGDMVLSHGGQSGVSLVMQAVLRGQRPVVLVEELSYPGFRRAAHLLRADVIGVPMDAQGIVPDALEELVLRLDAQLLCTSPEVHNPTGIFTPLERRRAIAQVAERTGLQILEDDCYRMGRARTQSYRAILPGQGWYVSSISKTLTPALRIGFAVAPKGQQSALRRTAEHGFFGLARPLADLTEDLLDRPETETIMQRVQAELTAYIGSAAEILAGYDLVHRDDMPFLWLRLPTGWRSGAFCQAAEARGVQVRAADEFALRDGRAPHAVRIGINAQVTRASFDAAIRRLRDLLDNPPEAISV